MSTNDIKIMQSIGSIETYTYWTNEEKLHWKEEITCNNVMREYKTRLTKTVLQKKT